MATPQIDPQTGERIQTAPQIDPQTGERITAPAGPIPTPPVPDMSKIPGATPGTPGLANYGQSPEATSVLKPSMLSRDGSPGTVAQKLFGDKPLTNSATVVGQHLKQLVTAPYHAFTDAPSSIPEQVAQGTNGQAGLGLYRMLAKPTVEGQGMDRIPIVGPMARGVENDASTYGALPALLGLGTDMAAPKAAEGLYGGAANLAGKGMQAAASTPEALKVAATRGLVTGTPGELLNRSLKPPVTMPDFEQSVEASLPKIAAQNPRGVSGFADAAKNSQAAEQDWYKGLTDPLGHFKVDASPIADAQMKSIPLIDSIEKPGSKTFPTAEGIASKGIVNDTASKSDNYRTAMPLSTVDSIRQGSNAKLQGFFNKAGGDKYAALSDPETARMAAVNGSSRDLAYNNFSRLSAAGRTDGGVPASDIFANQNLYGQLSDVAQVAEKRATVAGRANPLSLQESLQLHGNPLTQAYNFGASKLFKNLTDSDAVTNAAVDRFKNPNGISLPARLTPFAQALSTAGKGVGEASKLKPFLAPSIAAQGARKNGLYR